MSTFIVHDIETSPAPDRAAWLVSFCADEAYPGAPSNYKKPEALERHLNEWLQEQDDRAMTAWGKTALDSVDGRIVCVCALACDETGKVLRVFEETTETISEAELLTRWWSWCAGYTRRTWVGHYASTFDLPMLWRRSWLLGVRPPRPPGGWTDIVDTRELWQVSRANRDHIKLSRLAKAFGLDPKLEDDRYPHAWEAAVAGDWAWVLDRCRSDVEITAELWRRMTGRVGAP